MRRFAFALLPLAALLIAAPAAAASKPAALPAWMQRVDSAMHGQGQTYPGGVLRFTSREATCT